MLYYIRRIHLIVRTCIKVYRSDTRPVVAGSASGSRRQAPLLFARGGGGFLSTFLPFYVGPMGFGKSMILLRTAT